jgi:hypothetical protein
MREGTVQLDQLLLNANDRSLCRDEKSRHLSRLQWSYSISKFIKEVIGMPSIFQTPHPLWSIVRLSVLKPDNPPPPLPHRDSHIRHPGTSKGLRNTKYPCQTVASDPHSTCRKYKSTVMHNATR